MIKLLYFSFNLLKSFFKSIKVLMRLYMYFFLLFSIAFILWKQHNFISRNRKKVREKNLFFF